MSEILDLLLAGMDQPQADQQNMSCPGVVRSVGWPKQLFSVCYFSRIRINWSKKRNTVPPPRVPTRACIWGKHIPCMISAMHHLARLLHASNSLAEWFKGDLWVIPEGFADFFVGKLRGWVVSFRIGSVVLGRGLLGRIKPLPAIAIVARVKQTEQPNYLAEGQIPLTQKKASKNVEGSPSTWKCYVCSVREWCSACCASRKGTCMCQHRIWPWQARHSIPAPHPAYQINWTDLLGNRESLKQVLNWLKCRMKNKDKPNDNAPAEV
eukprot:1157334-Pelagomonas_calceolata.AAC.23